MTKQLVNNLKRKSSFEEHLSEEKVIEKLTKFSRGREERDGKIIKESYFAKQLDDDIYFKAMDHAGGCLLWIVIGLSYMFTCIFT